MDKLKHFFLCFAVTLLTDFIFPGLGWTYGLTVGLTIEATQAEYGRATVREFWKSITSKDTLLDLLADGLGIIAGLFIRKLI